MANVAHVVGAIMLVGVIGLLDLRILGYGREIPAHALGRAVFPLAIAGFLLLAASGAVLFVADARALVTSFVFQMKFVLIALAGVNAIAFRLRWPDIADAPTFAMRASAAASLLLWLAVVVAGRFIAYV